MLGSIPLFISADKNRKRALSVSFEQISLNYPGKYCTFPKLAFSSIFVSALAFREIPEHD
jgi:hypothetical protein